MSETCLLHGALIAANQGDDLFDLRSVRGLFFVYGISGFAAHSLGNKVEMQRKRRSKAGPLFRKWLCSGEGNTVTIVVRKNLFEGLIVPGNQSGHCAEVGREGNEVKEQRLVVGNFKANFLHAREKLGIGVAEEVNGLHGVADNEAGAALALGPGSDKTGEQLVLVAAGVLELVDQQMADAVGDGQ